MDPSACADSGGEEKDEDEDGEDDGGEDDEMRRMGKFCSCTCRKDYSM